VSQAHPLKPWFGREGTHEIAVLYGERSAIGGLGHLVLELTYP
jgi:hypothetical protein